MTSNLYWVYITCSGREEARTIGRNLLEQRLAACVNIFEKMESMYWWQGRIEAGEEAVLVAKTRQDRLEKLTEAVKAKHSYEVPCVVALPVAAGSEDYLNWLHGELDSSAAGGRVPG